MTKVLLDTNIILDFALEREKYFKNAENILKLAYENEINAWMSATTITNVYYIARKTKGKDIAINFIKNLIDFIEIANVDKNVIVKAISLNFNDFEDAIQESSALYNEIPIIITRNIHDFEDANLAIFTPEEFLIAFYQKNI